MADKKTTEEALLWMANYIHHDFTYLLHRNIFHLEKLTIEEVIELYLHYKDIGKDKEKPLPERIYAFLDKYAGVKPDWDGTENDDKYTSPDAYQMKYAADILSKGLKPEQCWSEWGGGGYKPYSSREGREEHISLMKEIYSIINAKK